MRESSNRVKTSLFCTWEVQSMEDQPTTRDGTRLGISTQDNATSKEMAVQSIKLPYTVMHFSAGILPCCWAQHPTWEASSSIFTEQEDRLHVPLRHEHTAPQRCISRVRDLVWMYTEFQAENSLKMENSTLVSILKTNRYLLYCQQCQLSHIEKWTSCTNFQGCAWHKPLRERKLIPIHPCSHRRSGRSRCKYDRSQAVQHYLRIFTAPATERSPKHPTVSRQAKIRVYPSLTEAGMQPWDKRWLSQG